MLLMISILFRLTLAMMFAGPFLATSTDEVAGGVDVAAIEADIPGEPGEANDETPVADHREASGTPGSSEIPVASIIQDAEDVNEPPRDASEAAPPVIETAEQLLDALEVNAAELSDFEADLTYRTDDAFGGAETFAGRIVYQVNAAESIKRFAIIFHKHQTGTQSRDCDERYVFDGAWLAEIDQEKKQFIKRQVVAPGDTFDPLKLGEGPFPLPIGQPKEQVLARFDAELVGLPDDGFLKGRFDDDDVYALRLTPRAGTNEAKEYQEVRIYYDRALMLPVGVDARERNGDRKHVWLRNLKRNEGVDESLLSIEIPKGLDWKIDIRAWRGDTGAPPPTDTED